MPHMAIKILTIGLNLRHSDSQTQRRSQVASLDFVVKTAYVYQS